MCSTKWEISLYKRLAMNPLYFATSLFKIDKKTGDTISVDNCADSAIWVYRKRRETRFSHYQCLYSGYRLGLCIVACSGCEGAAGGVGTGALAILMGSSLVELLGDG